MILYQALGVGIGAFVLNWLILNKTAPESLLYSALVFLLLCLIIMLLRILG